MKYHQKFLLAFLVLVIFSGRVFAQDTGLPPLGADAIQHVGQVISKYDKFTDKSKIELALRVKGDIFNGTYLFAACVYSGQVVPENAKVVLGIVSVSDEYMFETNNKIILLVDGDRQVYDPQRFPRELEIGKVIELLLIPREFSLNEFLKFANAKEFEGRAGGYEEFAVSAEQRRTLQEFARQMQMHTGGTGSTPSPSPAIELPSNFKFVRTLGEQTGLPVYNLMPDAEAMGNDAANGNTFQALGIIAQPDAGKVGLVLFNAQTQFQLQINQAKGAYITVGAEVIHVPEYQLLERKVVGQLKVEAAAIKISNDILRKLLRATHVTVQCGMVVYELDEDNIEAIKYLATQIDKDANTIRH